MHAMKHTGELLRSAKDNGKQDQSISIGVLIPSTWIETKNAKLKILKSPNISDLQKSSHHWRSFLSFSHLSQFSLALGVHEWVSTFLVVCIFSINFFFFYNKKIIPLNFIVLITSVMLHLNLKTPNYLHN